MFSNVTVMGGAEDALRLREGTGGDFRNYIIYDVGDDAIRNDDNGSELVTQDFSATAGLYPDYLYISSNTLMWSVGDQLFEDFEDTPSFAGTAIEANPGLSSAYMVVTPTAGGAAYQSVDAVADAWFTQTDYKGAFGQDNWLEGLSILSGTFGSSVDHCGTLTSDETWAASDEHLLTCQTFVSAGVTLTIEAGATVKSLADDGNGLAPALVVMQGGMLMAEGTAGAPITFLSLIHI